MAMKDLYPLNLSNAVSVGVPAVVALAVVSFLFLKAFFDNQRRKSRYSYLPSVPVVPGLPVIGNLLQLTEKKPYKTFAKWAETYGPIYSIKTGANKMLVLNNTSLAKEAMVTKFSSISTRKLSNALKILSNDKKMVALMDYDEFYKTSKKHLLTTVLGTNAQRRHGVNRNAITDNTLEQLLTLVRKDPLEAVNLREIFQSQLLAYSMKLALGKDVEESIYVKELGTTFSMQELFRILVLDPMEAGIDVDWRDFFPYLKWIPNKRVEMKVKRCNSRRESTMRSIIQEQRKRFESGEVLDCYVDYLWTEAKIFTENEISMLVWEIIVETSDTTMVATEWAMYEIAKNPEKQERLYRDIVKVCGKSKVTEQHLCKLPYLSAIFHETLRRHSPVPIIPVRYVHEDTELGGYHVPSGTEIAINIYGCNMDKNEWECPDEWKPERFIDDGKNNGQLDLYTTTIAFGGGKRVCAGAFQAMSTACLTIARLVQEFEWKLAEGERDNVHTLGLTNQKLNPLLAMIKQRN